MCFWLFRTTTSIWMSHHVFTIKIAIQSNYMVAISNQTLWKKHRAWPGFEPGTSHTQRENQTTRPSSHNSIISNNTRTNASWSVGWDIKIKNISYCSATFIHLSNKSTQIKQLESKKYNAHTLSICYFFICVCTVIGPFVW